MPRPVTPFVVPFVVSAMVVVPFYLVAPLLSLSSVLFIFVFSFLLVGIPLLVIGVKIIPKYERAVVFRLGRIIGVFGPGVIIVDPIIDRVYRVDIRAKTLEFELENVSTLDVIVRGVVVRLTYRIFNPHEALRNIFYKSIIRSETEKVIREEFSRLTLDEFLSERLSVEKRVLTKLNDILSRRGIEILSVELRRG